MIVSPFGFFEVQMEGVSGEAFKLCQPDLGQPPEAFDGVKPILGDYKEY